MTITALAAVVLVILILRLLYQHAGIREPWLKLVVALSLLVAAPELVYLGLLYTPMLVGMCCAVGSHLVLRRTLRRSGINPAGTFRSSAGVYLAGALLGLGGVFRWDILAYGAVIALDVLLDTDAFRREQAESFPRRLGVLMLAGAAAIVVWLGIELVTNDLRKAIPEMLAAAEETRGETQVGDIRVFGALAMFFSPAFLLASLIGAVLMARRGGRHLWFIIMLAVFAIAWPFWSTTKEVLVLIPAFGFVFAHGSVRIWRGTSHLVGAVLLKSLFVLLLIFPWLCGLQMTYGDSAWGPGFDVLPMSRPASTGIRNLRVVPGAGAAFPTNEGVRPLYGHGAVLLGGGWRAMAEAHAREIGHALAVANGRSIPVLAGMHYDGFVMNHAVRLGFTTRDPEIRRYVRRPVFRRLTEASGRDLMLVRQPIGPLCSDSVNVMQILQTTGSDHVVCWSEPGGTRRLYLFAPDAVQELGPRTAVVDLRALLRAVRNRSGT